MNKERIWGVVLLVAGLSVGYVIGDKIASRKEVVVTKTEIEKTDVKQTRLGKDKFTNPLLECDCTMPEPLLTTGYLRDDIQAYISKTISEGKASHVSVYFRDLNNGPWFGIDETELFTPASLLKVPTMIAVFKKAETNPLLLQKKVLCTKPLDTEYGVNVNDSIALTIGKYYTVEELVKQMIIYSDNRALQFLMNEVGPETYAKVFTDMQVVSPLDKLNDNLITVKEYSSFFRILYNASYLSQPLSEKALTILSQTTFKSGLVANLPPDVTVAHKYGERGFEGAPNLQLHDCGIVYSSNTPYLICVMSRGRNYKDLSAIIADISAKVYQSVSAQ